MKKLLITFLLLSAFTANAVSITLLPQSEGFFSKILRCKWHLSCYQNKLGVTITTINATDTIKNSRTTINDNFSNLNAGKIENATTSLPAVTTMAGLTSAAALATVGTITSGTWNASILTVSYGGTGSSTLSQYRILLGNGTGAIETATSSGAIGDFLGSNGAGVPPSWKSTPVNQTSNYTWTGLHTFNTYALNVASSTKINGQNYSWPSSNIRASSTLTVDSTNALTWQYPSKLIFSKTNFADAAQAASTTLFIGNIPANVLETTNSIIVTLWVDNLTIATGDRFTIDFGYGSASSTLVIEEIAGTGNTPRMSGKIEFAITGISASAQRFTTLMNIATNATSSVTRQLFSAMMSTTTLAAVTSSSVQPLTIISNFAGSSNIFRLSHMTVELLGALGIQ